MYRQSRKRKRRQLCPRHPCTGGALGKDKEETTTDAPARSDKLPSASTSVSSSWNTLPHPSSCAASASGESSPPQSAPHVKGRSPSPARIVRIKEHTELQTLNDRLSSHADHVKQLQSENTRLRLKLETMEGLIRRETRNIQQLSEADRHALQNSLDAAMQEKIKMEARCESIRRHRDSLVEQLTAWEKEVASMQARLSSLTPVSAENSRLERELATARTDLGLKTEQLGAVQADLMREKRIRRRLEDEAVFNKNRYLKEVEQASHRFSEHLMNTDKKLEASYEALLTESLTSVREHQRRDLETLKSEISSIYQTKLFEWKEKYERCNADLLASIKSARTLKQEQDDLRGQMTDVKAAKAAVEVQLQEAYARNGETKNQAENDRCQAQKEMALLLQELAEVKDELEELGGVNCRLEEEITAYRVILDDLENESPSRGPLRSTGDTTTATTTMTTMTTRCGKHAASSSSNSSNRLQAFAMEGGEERVRGGSSLGAVCKGQTVGARSGGTIRRFHAAVQAVHITHVDGDGRFVRLCNSADHTVDLCLWMLQKTDHKGTQIIFEIPTKTLVSPGQCVTIWSHARRPGIDNAVSGSPCSDRRRINHTDGSMELEPEPEARLDDEDEGEVHLVMATKSWRRVRGRCRFSLKDGDGQTQDQCDVTATSWPPGSAQDEHRDVTEDEDNRLWSDYAASVESMLVETGYAGTAAFSTVLESEDTGLLMNASTDGTDVGDLGPCRERPLAMLRHDQPMAGSCRDKFDPLGGGDGAEMLDKDACKII